MSKILKIGDTVFNHHGEAKVTKIEMWTPTFAEVQKDYRSRNPKMDPDTVIITNSCGKIRAEFDVVVSTEPMEDRFSLTSSIGEWCK